MPRPNTGSYENLAGKANRLIVTDTRFQGIDGFPRNLRFGQYNLTRLVGPMLADRYESDLAIFDKRSIPASAN